MATRTQHAQAQEKTAEAKARSDANGSVPESIIQELREARSKGTTLAEPGSTAARADYSPLPAPAPARRVSPVGSLANATRHSASPNREPK
jgi:hypothetical protein